MRKVLKVECKRAFSGKAFYLCLGIGFTLCAWLLCEQIIEVNKFQQWIAEYGMDKVGLYYPRSLYNSFIGLDYAYLPPTILYTIFPLLVTLPHAISYYYDKKSGYLKNVLTRVKKSDYYVAKWISVFLSGFATTLLILLFGLWISALFFPALTPEATTATYCPCDTTAMMAALFYTKPLIYTLIYIFIDAVFYGVIATIALGISCYADNIMLVFSGSMILYLLADYLAELLGKENFSPLKFLKPTQFGCSTKPAVILAELLLIALTTALLFLWNERKKDVF